MELKIIDAKTARELAEHERQRVKDNFTFGIFEEIKVAAKEGSLEIAFQVPEVADVEEINKMLNNLGYDCEIKESVLKVSWDA